MQPRLALVSIGIRRDLLAPLLYFSKFDLVHFYKKNVYGDLTAEDFDSTLNAYASPLDLYRKLTQTHPDVIQGVEPFSFYTQPYVWACVMAARKTGAALLIPTYENRPLDVKFGKGRAAFLRRALEIYFARACLIIVHNDGARRNVLECHGAPHKIVRGMWGSWGVDLREFFPRRERNGGGERHSQQTERNNELIEQSGQRTERNGVRSLLYVGRLHEEKGVFVLLDAFAKIYQEMTDVQLIMAGDGPARPELESRIQALSLTDAVTLVGVVKNREVPELFRQADVFCAPSITTRKWAEQVGMSALQAMACGVPIVSTQSGAIPEYIPDGVAGILIRENDAHALADALKQLLTNPERARALGKQGYAYARAHYDAQANVERGEQLVMEHCLARRV